MKKITFEDEDRKITIETKYDLDIFEFSDLCQQLALAIGYHPNSVDKGWNKESGVLCDECKAMMIERNDDFICPDCGARRNKINLQNNENN